MNSDKTESRAGCPSWCTRVHPAAVVASAALVGHDATLAEHTDPANGVRIRVCLVWNQRTDRQPSDAPMVAVYAATLGEESVLALNEHDADVLADLLTLVRGPVWLSKALAAASAALYAESQRSGGVQ